MMSASSSAADASSHPFLRCDQLAPKTETLSRSEATRVVGGGALLGWALRLARDTVIVKTLEYAWDYLKNAPEAETKYVGPSDPMYSPMGYDKSPSGGKLYN